VVGQPHLLAVFFPNDPLWDGEGCVSSTLWVQ